MKFKYHLSLATFMLPFMGYTQTELYVQDLNYIPKAQTFAYQGSISGESSTQRRESGTSGSLLEYKTESSSQYTDHILGYGISDRLTAYLETSYVFNEESEIKDLEFNGATLNVQGTPKNDGLHYLKGGLNWRFLEQSTDHVNADIRFSYSSGLQDAKRGALYDSNNDGASDKGSTGNSSQISPEFTIGVAAGKKFEQFEIRGLLGVQVSTSGSYKQVRGNTDGSDLKVNKNSTTALIYQLSGQLKLSESLFAYGKVTQVIATKQKERYTDSSGDINTMEVKDNMNLGIDLGGKIALVQNKVFLFGELHGDVTPEQEVITKTNGSLDNLNDKMKSTVTGRLTVGLLASF